jgi:predicted secreted hydrolase
MGGHKFGMEVTAVHDASFDRLTRRVAGVSLSRRLAIGRLGGAALAAIGLAKRGQSTVAQDATPPGTNQVLAEAQDRLDALDADTRDSLARALWATELRAEDLTEGQLGAVLSEKNSNEAFGQRMGIHLIELAVSPPSFVPDAADRYAAFYPYCSSLSAHQAYAMRGLLGPEQSQGYQQVPEQADFVFPQVNAMQLDSMLGWYFFVGSCTDVEGNEYGVELMFFGGGLLPPARAAQLGLSDLENQVFEMHFAIARAGDRHYQAKPIVLAGTSGLLQFEPDGLGAAMGKNVIRSLDADNVFPVQIQAWGQDDGEAEPVQLSIDLTFSSGKGYLLQGDEGCTPCCDGLGTLYYSIPNLQLDPSVSTLTLDGETFSLATGVFWFDHQWGMLNGIANSAVVRAVNTLQPAGPGGWDWFEAQFSGDRQITCAAPHTNAYRPFYFQTGDNPPDTMQVTVHGKCMDEASVTHSITGTLKIPVWIKSEKSPAPAVYPPTGTWYPNRWEFTFGEEVPEEIRAFSMTPIVSGGQSGFFASGAQYSEGAVYLRNEAGEDIGRGFAESVQYADTLANQLRLAGLPVNDEMMALLQSD